MSPQIVEGILELSLTSHSILRFKEVNLSNQAKKIIEEMKGENLWNF